MRRFALLLSILAWLALLGGFLVPGVVADWLLALGCALLPAALILLGSWRADVKARGLRFGILLLFLLLAGVLSALLIWRAHDPTGVQAVGRLLLQLCGLWLATLVLTGIVFPLTFDSFWPDDGDTP